MSKYKRKYEQGERYTIWSDFCDDIIAGKVVFFNGVAVPSGWIQNMQMISLWNNHYNGNFSKARKTQENENEQ